ncbi:MAG: DHH family phosphoesterase [Bacilli bacterium]|nr:DHH family phosphoesterase [Bacilli bacterium]
MSKSLARLRKLVLAIIIIEAILISSFAVLYSLVPEIKQFFTENDVSPIYWLVIVVVIFFIDSLILIIGTSHLKSLRQHSDLKAASLIGSDVQEAYNFGQIGLVVCDDDGTVMWANDLFNERKIDLIDTKIADLNPELAGLIDAPIDMEVKIVLNDRSYYVKYLSEAHLYIFKDATDFEVLYEYSKNQATVIGLFIIDNYHDLTGSAEDDNTDVVAKVRTVILDYCKEHNVLLRRFKNDSYLAICNYASLVKLEEDKFSILDTVRAQGNKDEITPTLSIAFAHNVEDIVKLNEMASNALDLAMSRGGDQAVVSEPNADSKFFGGKTAALETTSKVKARSEANSIISLIKEAGNVIIMGHTKMDMDALGSCLGIMAICEYCNKGGRAKIVYDPKKTEKKARYAFQGTFGKTDLERLTISPKDALDRIKETTLLIVVDVCVPYITMEPKLLDKAQKIVVIDHHRAGESTIERPVLSYIEPSASSASELIAEMIHYATANPAIDVKQAYATLMLSGIFLDTNNFKSKTVGMRTFEAAEILKSYGADNSLADDFLKDELEEFTLITSIISHMHTPYYGVVYCLSDDEDIVDEATLAKVGNQVMSLKSMNACFVIGRTQEGEVRLSARSDGTVNVQLICEKMGGGGHYNAAAAQFRNNATVASVEALLKETLDTYLNDAKSAPRKN